jgi:hypothetical protein
MYVGTVCQGKSDSLIVFGLSYSGPPAPLQTEFSRFCEMKYLPEKETHNKNEENTLKELSEIFLTIYGFPK